MSVNEHNSCSISDRGAGYDPEAMGLAFHHQSPTFINAYCQAAANLVDRDWGLLKQTIVNPDFLKVKLESLHTAGNMGVMNCLSQVGLALQLLRQTLGDTWIMDLTSSSWRQYTSQQDIYSACKFHTSSLGLNSNVIIIDGTDEDNYVDDNIFHLMLEPENLQKLALHTIYMHNTELPWKCLPEKLIALLDMPEKKEEKIVKYRVMRQ